MSSPATSSHPPTHTPWWLWFNVLSLDAPLVAVLWQAALAMAYQVRLPPACYWTLGLTVWLIYFTDRTLDGFTKPTLSSHTARHAFYRRYRKLFLFLIIPALGATTAFMVLTSIPAGLLWRGIGLGFLVGLYLLYYAARGHRLIFILGSLSLCFIGGLILWVLPLPLMLKAFYTAILLLLLAFSFNNDGTKGFRLMPKEMLCGYFFAVGCSISVNFYTLDSQAGPLSLETIMFGLLCAFNCVGIAVSEREADALNDPHAITQTWPGIAKVYPFMLVMLLALATFAFSRPMPAGMKLYVIAIILSTLQLGAVYFISKRQSPALSHVLADLALILPIAVLLLIH